MSPSASQDIICMSDRLKPRVPDPGRKIATLRAVGVMYPHEIIVFIQFNRLAILANISLGPTEMRVGGKLDAHILP